MTEAAFHPADEPTPIAAAAAEPQAQRAPVGLDALGRPWPPFAHGSEAEMARILDFYGVVWEYEPRTFPILWNLDGEVVESFSPDFYLPGLDLFLELTTLKQRLVRKKNRKLRRLRELYPDIRIKLFYARDFRAMMLKYGRLALVDSMSGALGQVMPERPGHEGPAGRPAGPDLATIEAAPAATGRADPATPAHPSETAGPGPAAGDPVHAAGPFGAAPAIPVPGRGRNASRSRRRRAAAAARAAAALTPAKVSGPPRRRDDERTDR